MTPIASHYNADRNTSHKICRFLLSDSKAIPTVMPQVDLEAHPVSSALDREYYLPQHSLLLHLALYEREA